MNSTDIRLASTQKDHRDIRKLFVEEMSPEVVLPELPTTSRVGSTSSQLTGYWENNQLVAAVFTRPLHQEANAIKRNRAIEPSIRQRVHTWLLNHTKMIELIATRSDQRRRHIATNLLSTITAQARDNHCDFILAVARDDTAANLFRKSDYFVYKPRVSLMLTAQHPTHEEILGQLPGMPDTFFALKELHSSDNFTFRVHHPLAIQRQDGNPNIRPHNTKAFLYTP
ncbi:GNAT family N-acetyltransferase [Corynebacterium sp. 12B]|uniref:GNAT family N-acetyltransferase n=1 Tax=Corynebacterium sp. 12B TaxID=2080509 RepID=UPI00124C9827|nr:GNAT family N-acetyltransferase [Corynebacterium sp. 12B]